MSDKETKLFKIAMTNHDMEALIELLNFANTAAVMLAKKEMTDGFGISAATKFTRMSTDAQDFVNTLVDHLSMGEPTDGNVH